MGQPSHPPGHPPEPAPADRLESWKEIAVYLKKGVRTVQRWEREEGLPVHRHLHDKLGTVYAYKAQLDAWWQDGHSRLEQQEQTPATLWPRLRWAVLAAVAVVALVFGAWWGVRRMGQPDLPFQERDWVLVGNFENRTGEPIFDGVLDYALERELSNSRFVNVVPRPRVEDSLRLMQKPLEASVDIAVGREVCLRDGGIRALLMGRVEKMDSTYLLSANLVEPASGRSVASFSEEAAGQKEVVAALRLLSNRVRETLGEKLALIQRNEQKLEKVSTPSLRALQLFSQGSVLKEQGQFKPAEEFLRQAIVEDPDFASAHLWLAFAIGNQGRPESEYLPHFERALALSDRVTEHEQYFIRGSYYFTQGQYEQAAAAYEALLRIYPDHYFGVRDLVWVYWRLGRLPERSQLILRQADLRPTDFVANVMAARHAYYRHHNWPVVQTYLDRARRALTPELRTGEYFANFAAEIEMLPVHRQWFEGNLDEARRLVAVVAKSLDSPSDTERGAVALHLGIFELTLGRIKAAEEAFQNIPEEGWRGYWLATAAFARGDERQAAKLTNSYPSYLTVALAARAGHVVSAEQMLRKMQPNRDTSLADLILARAEIALARGAVSEANAALQEVIHKEDGRVTDSYILAAVSLASVWNEQGELDRAIRLLEEASARSAFVDFFNGYAWFRMRAQLAQLYRLAGRNDDAQRVEQELRRLLRYADPDHPVLLGLQTAQTGKLAQVKD